MEPEQFVYWLQGFVETNGGIPPTKEQWSMICDHLKTIFHKTTPQYPQRLYPPSYPPIPTEYPSFPTCKNRQEFLCEVAGDK